MDIEEEIEKLNDWNAQGRFAEVAAETNTLITSSVDETPEDLASLFVAQGNAQYGLGRFEDALTSYAKAIELDTFDVQARCNYGSTLFTLGRYVDALNACDAAILTDEDFAPAYINVAHCLVALKHEEEAVYALQQAFSLEPENAELGRTVAEMAADLENFEVALETYLDIAELPDAASDTQQAIHDLFVRFKNHEDVERNDWLAGIDQWRDKFPNNPEVLRLTSDLLRTV